MDVGESRLQSSQQEVSGTKQLSLLFICIVGARIVEVLTRLIDNGKLNYLVHITSHYPISHNYLIKFYPGA